MAQAQGHYRDPDFPPAPISQGKVDKHYPFHYEWRHVSEMVPPGTALGGATTAQQLVEQAKSFSQGLRGNCWYLAPLASGMRKEEEAERIFLSEPVNDEIAMLSLVDGDRKKVVRMDLLFPSYRRRPVYCKPSDCEPSDASSYSAPLAEKGGAILMGNYGLMDEGGFRTGASMLYHGCGFIHNLELPTYNPLKVATELIMPALAMGHLVGLCTMAEPNIDAEVEDDFLEDWEFSDDESVEAEEGVGAENIAGQNGEHVPAPGPAGAFEEAPLKACFEYLQEAVYDHAFPVLDCFFVKIEGHVDCAVVFKNIHNKPTHGTLYPGATCWPNIDEPSQQKILKWINGESGILVTTMSVCLLRMKWLDIFHRAAPVPDNTEDSPQTVVFNGKDVEIHFHTDHWQKGPKPVHVINTPEGVSEVLSSMSQIASQKAKGDYLLSEIRLYEIPDGSKIPTHAELIKQKNWLATSGEWNEKQLSACYIAKGKMTIAVVPIFKCTKVDTTFYHTTRITKNPHKLKLPEDFSVNLLQYQKTLQMQGTRCLDHPAADPIPLKHRRME